MKPSKPSYSDIRQKCKDIVCAYLDSPQISNTQYDNELTLLYSGLGPGDFDLIECIDAARSCISAIYQHYLSLCEISGLFDCADPAGIIRGKQVAIMRMVKSLFKKPVQYNELFY